MNTDDLEKLLEAGTETPQLDFKESCPWDVKTFAKDILAMSNMQDGGTLVIGVEEKSGGIFERQGISATDKPKYKRDEMKDQIAAYADPHVDFTVHFPKDKSGLDYVVIKVDPFKEIPVICRKNGADVKEGGIYYRNRNRRIESALVSNSFDMRDIIERAALKMRARAKSLGYTLPSLDDTDMFMKVLEDRLKKERGDL